MNVPPESDDIIDRQLKELDDERVRARRTQLFVVLGFGIVIALLLAGGVSAVVIMQPTTSVKTDIRNELTNQIQTVFKNQLQRRIKVSVEEWTSPAFASGGVSCGAHTGNDSPCLCWFSTAPSSSTDCTPLAKIAEANKDAILVLADGGHDRQHLKDSLRKTHCCNRRIAMARAELVAEQFKQQLQRARNKTSDVEHPTTGFLLSTRGAHDYTTEDPNDRTVRITLVRIQESP
jgi:hypothetical protein